MSQFCANRLATRKTGDKMSIVLYNDSATTVLHNGSSVFPLSSFNDSTMLYSVTPTGGTSYGPAVESVSKLLNNFYSDPKNASLTPVIVFVSDGEPLDVDKGAGVPQMKALYAAHCHRALMMQAVLVDRYATQATASTNSKWIRLNNLAAEANGKVHLAHDDSTMQGVFHQIVGFINTLSMEKYDAQFRVTRDDGANVLSLPLDHVLNFKGNVMEFFHVHLHPFSPQYQLCFPLGGLALLESAQLSDYKDKILLSSHLSRSKVQTHSIRHCKCQSLSWTHHKCLR